ncbi:conserved hypothetical protein [Hyphomicrobiales bacterium]|jgi:hypothetical protein|nr:conserved hypothetical protein [Hyphomicrobiales bacterium]CAH1702858.1 hypothetical protein BOSEA1005_30730 [Hyphomicrobiales bacterium]CAI0347045.1 conserved hypothetical protein [Hyphomicrobiales bacterium]
MPVLLSRTTLLVLGCHLAIGLALTLFVHGFAPHPLSVSTWYWLVAWPLPLVFGIMRGFMFLGALLGILVALLAFFTEHYRTAGVIGCISACVLLFL